MESIPAKITGRGEQWLQMYSSLTPVFSKYCVYHSPKRLLAKIPSRVKDRELC